MTTKPKRAAHPRGAWRTALTAAACTFGAISAQHAAAASWSMSECKSALASGDALATTPAPLKRYPQPPLIGVGSGPRDQTYYQVIEDLVQMSRERERDPVPLVNVETAGSLDNMTTLRSTQNMPLALAQSDALDAAVQGSQPPLVVVMPLYQEEIHVLVRRVASSGEPLNRLRDLNGQRVRVSAYSGGSLYTAQRLFRMAGVVPRGGDVRPLPADEALCSVLTGEAEATVIVSGQPVASLRNLQRLVRHPARPLEQVTFLRLKAEDLGGNSTGPGAVYEAASIERGSYPWAFPEASEPNKIDTLAVRALLIGFDFSPGSSRCEAVRKVVAMLKDTTVRERLCQVPHHRKWCQFDPEITVPGWRKNRCT